MNQCPWMPVTLLLFVVPQLVEAGPTDSEGVRMLVKAIELAQTGKSVDAEKIFQQLLDNPPAGWADNSAERAAVHGYLAGLYRDTGRFPLAAEHFDQHRRVLHRHIHLAYQYATSDVDVRSFQSFTIAEDVALALARPEDRELAALAAGWVLNSKGMSHWVSAQAILTARARQEPQMAQHLKEMHRVREQLARVTLEGPKQGQEQAHKQQLEDLRDQERQLGRRLAEGTPGIAALPWLTTREIQSHLAPGAVFLDCARVKLEDASRKTSPEHYVAWITPKTGRTHIVDLGDALALDAMIAETRKALSMVPTVLKAEGEISAEKTIRAPLAKLAQRILAPIRPHLEKTDRWVISPDSSLWLVPWSALPLDEKTYAIEKHTIQLLVSGREMIARPRVPGKLGTPVIFADPDFNGNAPPPPGNLRDISNDLKLGRIPRLPSTATEAIVAAEKMATIFGTDPLVYTNEKATSSAFLALRRPQAITLATHGYFLSGRGDDAEDPLLRCGLLLAGGNKPGDAGRAGVLTGREVLSADLRGCELVILSACETGLGDVRQGEGVAGLRQAFQLAGAESVLASLWKVPDDETTLQMVAFMDALAKGKDRVEALAIAQRQRIAQRREKFGAAHPFNWAAFTLTGNASAGR